MGPRSLALPAALVLATAAGLALRLQRLGTESLWYDEVAQLEWSDQPLGTFLVERWDQVDPPLNELFSWFWNNAMRDASPEFARSETGVRLPAVLFGTATIPVVGLAGATAFGGGAGALAALLIATNPYHVRYSQEARMYALTGLMSACALLFLVRALRDDARPRDAKLFGVFAALAAYAHFYALGILAAALAATLLLRFRARRSLLIGEALGFALVIPYLAGLAIHVATSRMGTRPWLTSLKVPISDRAARTAADFGVDLLHAAVPALAPGSVDAIAVHASLVALGLLLLFGAARRDAFGARAHVAAIAFLPPIAILAATLYRPLFHPRYLLFALPALAMLAGRAKPWALAALPIGVGLLVLPRYHAAIEKPDYRAVAAVLNAEFASRDVLSVSLIDRLPLRFYVEGSREPNVFALEAVASADEERPPASLPRGTKPGRTFVVDLFPAWHQLYAVDARSLFERALAERSSTKSLYASEPIPLWRVSVRSP